MDTTGGVVHASPHHYYYFLPYAPHVALHVPLVPYATPAVRPAPYTAAAADDDDDADDADDDDCLSSACVAWMVVAAP